MNKKKVVAVIGNMDFTLLKFRSDIIKEMVENDCLVYALVPNYSEESKKKVESLGAVPIEISLSRTGMNPLRDFWSIILLTIQLRKLKVTHTLSYYIKPVIYGSIAAKLAGVKNIYSMIGGLGYIYSGKGQGKRKKALRSLVNLMYKRAFSFNSSVFLQNAHDAAYLVKNKLLDNNQAVIVNGSGVNLNDYPNSNFIDEPITFTLSARMIVDKGVNEFVEAARIVKKTNPSVKFILVGGTDENPNSISEKCLSEWQDEGIIQWTGHVQSVQPYLQQTSVFVLPSYREGTPRSTLEAMSMGRPVITTNAPGCMETVINGQNGFLVPVKNEQKLADAMLRFIENPDLIQQMGIESRKIAREKFDVRKVNQAILETMGIL